MGALYNRTRKLPKGGAASGRGSFVRATGGSSQRDSRMTVRRRYVSVAVLTAIWLCIFGRQRIVFPENAPIMWLRSEVMRGFLIRSVVPHDEGAWRRLLHHGRQLLPAIDVPPFFMRAKVAESTHLRDDRLERELEHIVVEHLTPLFQEQLPAAAIPTLHATLTRERRPDGHEVLEVAFTGSIRYSDHGRQSSPSDIVAVLRRGLLTREEYTRLVDSMHNSEELPVVRGVKVSLVPFPHQQHLEPLAPERIQVSSTVDAAATLAADEYGQMRLVALLSMGALLSIVLFVIDFFTRPKRKNWKVTKRRLSDEPSRLSTVIGSLSWGTWVRRRRPVSARPPGWRRSPLRDDDRDAQHRRSRSGDVPVTGRSPVSAARSSSAATRPSPVRSSSYDKLEAMVVQRNAALARRALPVVARSNSLDASSGDGDNHRSVHPQSVSGGVPPASPPRRGRRRASLEVVSGADGIL